MALTGRILITGGAGTLGRAIMFRAQEGGWEADFTVYSRNETLQAQTRTRFPKARYVLGDVRDYARLEAAVAGHDIIIHAAAMKRLPDCEAQPYECWQTNVVGSHNVARAAQAQGVRLVVGISTDKACAATTMYGASKLAMEKIFRAVPAGTGTDFVLVRYGNVVASRGSVIPIWKAQAKKGEPLSVTDPAMTRFWMSPFAAVAMVDQAATCLQHGEILVKKLKSLSIAALAGIVVPGAPFTVTGLRSEEKKHEDLVHRNEPCIEEDGQVVITAAGASRMFYDSDHAERLTEAEFKAMFADAVKLESV